MISIAMAVYNGEKYLEEQLDSILSQIGKNDEIVISYNHSSDNSLQIIMDYSKKYPNIKYYICEKNGVLNNFENAIYNCKGEIIFLSDQDDVWVNNKVAEIIPFFDDDNVFVVAHDKIYVDEKLNPLKNMPFRTKNKKKYVSKYRIICKNNIQGSCLAFRKQLKDYILPFPNDIPMHDSWIGIMADMVGKVVVIDKKLLLYRMHSNNVTSLKHKKIRFMINDRFLLIKNYVKRKYEVRYHND